MALIETALVFGMGWLLGKGVNGKKKTPSTPSQVPWPSSERPLTKQEKQSLQATADKFSELSKSKSERDADAMAAAMAEAPEHRPKA